MIQKIDPQNVNLIEKINEIIDYVNEIEEVSKDILEKLTEYYEKK